MVTMQVNTPIRNIAMLQRRLHPWQVEWRSYCMRHAVEKTFLVAQPVQPVALTSQVACFQSTMKK